MVRCGALVLLAGCAVSEAPRAGSSAARVDPAAALGVPSGDAPPVAWVTLDLDGDGLADLLSMEGDTSGTRLRALSGLGEGGVVRGQSPVMLPRRALEDGALATGDVDGDGHVDAVVVSRAQVTWFRGVPGGLRLDGEALTLDARWLTGEVAIGDVNGDGVDDLAAVNQEWGIGDILVWFGGPGGPAGSPDISLPQRYTVALADVDGDGDDDLATVSGPQLWLYEARDGALLPEVRIGALSNLVSVTGLPDADLDGDEELATRRGVDEVPGGGHLDVWTGDPGLQLQRTTLPVPTGAGGLAAGDVDLDGFPDLVVYAEDRLVLFTGGAGGFLPDRAFAMRVTGPLLPLVAAASGGVVAEIGDPTRPEIVFLPLLPPDADLDQDGAPAAVDPDDTRPEAWPGAPELPANGLDEDGDGWDLCGIDRDRDGFGAGPVSTIGGCDALSLVPDLAVIDCDDTRSDANPASFDQPGLLLDLNCDGAIRCWVDGDGDGWGGEDLLLPGDADCDDPGESELGRQDCDDADPAIHPGATGAIGSGFDVNCDGRVSCFLDVDGDGARAATWEPSEAIACDVPGVALATAPFDCDDADAAVFTGATELPADGVDQDCDGAELCFAADSPGETMRSDDLDCVDAGEAVTPAVASGGCALVGAPGGWLVLASGMLWRRRAGRSPGGLGRAGSAPG